MSELKNCPFCGSPAVHIKNNVGVNYITCSNTYEQSKGDCVYDLRVNPKDWSRRSVEAEITALKGELKREREMLDMFCDLRPKGKARKIYGEFGCQDFVWEFDQETIDLARETQKQRKIEL